MWIYIVLLLLVGLFALIPYTHDSSEQSKKWFLILSFAIMTMILGFRGNYVGEDTLHYINVFNCAKNVTWRDISTCSRFRVAYYTDEYGYTDTIEIGIIVIAKIIHVFTDNAQIFLFLISASTCALFAKFIYDDGDEVVYPTFVFICDAMFMFSFNGARQMLAIAIGLQAYHSLQKGNKWRALWIIVLAAMIHNTALIYLLLFPINIVKPMHRQQIFKVFAIIAFAAPVVVILGQTVLIHFFPRYEGYFLQNYWESGLGGSSILLLIELAFIVIMYHNGFNDAKSFQLATYILIFISFEIAGLRVSAFPRLGYYFRAFLLLFLPCMDRGVSGKSRIMTRSVMMMLLLLLYMSYARVGTRSYYFFWS